MVGHELAIEQQEMAKPEPCHEPCQRDFRRIGAKAEHRFAEKGATEAHPVEAADQLAIFALAVPAFDRMRLTGGVQAERRALDVGVDPCLLAVGAGVDDLGEGGVAGDGKLVAPDAPGERARRAEAA